MLQWGKAYTSFMLNKHFGKVLKSNYSNYMYDSCWSCEYTTKYLMFNVNIYLILQHSPPYFFQTPK